MSSLESDKLDPVEQAQLVRRYSHLLPNVDAAPQPTLIAPNWSGQTVAQARDRAVGCFLGLAVGDAVGTTVEFKPRDSFPKLTDMVGGGPFKLAPGEWTDDTTMALCLAESLLAKKNVDQRDLITRFQGWLERGENTVPGKCFDIGNATRAAIERFAADDEPSAGSEAADTAGNGSLVRLAPLAIFSASDPPRAEVLAMRQSRTTHSAPYCVDACKLFVAQLADALNGATKDEALRQRVMALSPTLLVISAGEYKTKTRDEIKSSGYVVHTLEAALWSVWQTDNFKDAVLTAANLGDDADSVAAAAGQLAGALWRLRDSRRVARQTCLARQNREARESVVRREPGEVSIWRASPTYSTVGRVRRCQTGAKRAFHDAIHFAIQSACDVARMVVLNIDGFAEFARPSPARQLTAGVSEFFAVAVKCYLFKIRLKFAIGTNDESKRFHGDSQDLRMQIPVAGVRRPMSPGFPPMVRVFRYPRDAVVSGSRWACIAVVRLGESGKVRVRPHGAR